MTKIQNPGKFEDIKNDCFEDLNFEIRIYPAHSRIPRCHGDEWI